MDRFKELTTFVEVAQRGSLSAAAREEGITPAMVGRRIDQLEERQSRSCSSMGSSTRMAAGSTTSRPPPNGG